MPLEPLEKINPLDLCWLCDAPLDDPADHLGFIVCAHCDVACAISKCPWCAKGKHRTPRKRIS